ncbi:esterase [Ramlibacter sp.]|uniref:esterase n=1 Tax=Ramlibacter sp. TaxID=1917967 RepID=UPI003D0F96AF
MQNVTLDSPPPGALIVARPSAPAALVLLFHGVGATAEGLVGLGQCIARQRPDAMVVSVAAARPSTLGAGREWFSVVGITEENRPGRIAEAMPAFESTVSQWQTEAGVRASRTTLVGFSQGAIMSLEATQVVEVAGRVIALSGRMATPARRAPAGVVYRFVHGDADRVVDARFSIAAANELQALGADASVEVVPGLGHGIDERVIEHVLRALQ